MPDFESIRQTPQSSTIACIQYAPKERVLRVKFKGFLGHYDYFDVQPGQIADLFMRRSAVLSAVPDFHDGQTTWVISEFGQKAHVTESPEELSKLLEQPVEVEA